MTDKTNDGGPAFPSAVPLIAWNKTTDETTQYQYQTDGMALRDYFATHASEKDIQQFMPATVGDVRDFQEKHGFEPTRQWARYQHADAMLKARGRQ